MNNERVGSSDYQIVRSERKTTLPYMVQRCPQLPYMAQTCPQNILHSKISLRLRHNVPQACDETFCSRGTEIRQLIGSRIR